MLNRQEYAEKRWEAEVLITSLLKLTENRIISWECLAYEPPMLVEADDLFLSHKLTAATECEGDLFQVELLETIDVKTGKGSVDLSIIIRDDPQTREEALERFITFFPEDRVKIFSDLLFEQISDSVAGSPRWVNTRFAYQTFPADTMKHPIAVLGRTLFDQKQVRTFHKICSDRIALKKLLDEQAITACGQKSHCCCFTGHRPEKLTVSEEEVKTWLEEKINDAVSDGFTTFITGMAQGTDLWAGQIVLRQKEEGAPVRLICAFPYPGFGDQWAEKWNNLRREVISSADAIAFINPAYSPSCFQRRNEWMVDRCARVIAVFNGSAGGTKNTLEYARKLGCEVIL